MRVRPTIHKTPTRLSGSNQKIPASRLATGARTMMARFRPLPNGSAAQLAHVLKGRRAGFGWMARCPAHNDRTPSLSISEGDDGKVLVHCFVCPQDRVIDVLRAKGLW